MIPTSLVVDLVTAFKNNKQEDIDFTLTKVIKIAQEKKQSKLAQKLKKLYSFADTSYSTQGLTIQNSTLYERRISNIKLDDIILSDINLKIFKEFIDSYKLRHKFKELGIQSENKLLVYGPPGTGKTLFTYVLAGELNLPVFHVHLDNLVSSYLGETGKNIREIFEDAKKEECILFIDEFDAVAKNRDDNQELGELKRVVTVLLQNIDQLSSNNILICTTNHEHLLDNAIWRRFDFQLNIDVLDTKSKTKLLKLYLKDFDKEINFQLLSEITEGLAGSFLKQLVNKSLREYITAKQKDLDLNNLLLENFVKGTILKYKKNKTSTDNKILINILTKLREYDKKYFTFNKLEQITGIPHSTLNYKIKK